MSIQEIQGPLSAATKKMAKQDAVFGSLPGVGKPKRSRTKKEAAVKMTHKNKSTWKPDQLFERLLMDVGSPYDHTEDLDKSVNDNKRRDKD